MRTDKSRFHHHHHHPDDCGLEVFYFHSSIGSPPSLRALRTASLLIYSASFIRNLRNLYFDVLSVYSLFGFRAFTPPPWLEHYYNDGPPALGFRGWSTMAVFMDEQTAAVEGLR